MPKPRGPLKVLPVLVWDEPVRKVMTSWRGWGGIHTVQAAAAEVRRIDGDLSRIAQNADFPVEFDKTVSARDITQVADSSVGAADLVIVYGAGGAINGCENFGKDVIIFQRHRSGPLYLQYEIVSPRFLRQHTDELALKSIRFDDVVTDSLEELTWRLRSLCGLKNARGAKVLCIGGPNAWGQPPQAVQELVHSIWNLELPTVDYEHLGQLIDEAKADATTIELARRRSSEYLNQPTTRLETSREFVVNCFVLDQIFRSLMANADCRSITINGCMSTIMPKAKTSACLTLSTLNDDGYLAFCESDFVVIPAGLLLANISGRPVFLNDPTYPHDHLITLAHCTGPRKMDGATLAPARIMTHFESDYGAAPKVEMPKGQTLTNIAPDFKSRRWMGLVGEVEDTPLLPICRDQLELRYDVPDQLVAEHMPGFHWMTCFGDYSKEVGYALRRVGIAWDKLSKG
jgi:L-fucose isomerase-like protein